MRLTFLIIIVLNSLLVTSQDTSFNVNLGLDEIKLSDSYATDFNDFIDGPFNEDFSYAFAKSDKIITLWDLENRVVAHNFYLDEIAENYVDQYPYRSFSKVYFVPEKSEIYFTIRLFNENTQQEKFLIVFYDYQTKDVTREIILDNIYDDVLYESYNQLILIEGSESHYDMELNRYEIKTNKLTFIRNHYTDKGINFLRWQRIKNELYYSIVADQRIGIYSVNDTFNYQDVSYPDGYDLETNYVTSVALAYDLEYAIVKHSNKSFITELKDNKVVHTGIPTTIGTNLSIEILLNKKGTKFIYEKYESGQLATNKTKINLVEFDIKKGSSKQIATITNSIEAKRDFFNFNKLITKEYNVSRLLNFMDFNRFYKSYRIEEKRLEVNGNLWVTAFANGKITVYNSHNGSFKTLDFKSLQKCSNNALLREECKIAGMELYKNHVVIAFLYDNLLQIATINLQTEKLINVTQINDVSKVENFKIDKKETQILISLLSHHPADEEQMSIKTALFDLNLFRIQYLDLFENNYFDLIYETNDNKWIAGYQQDLNRTLLFDKSSLKLLRSDIGLIFVSKGNDYRLNIETRKEIVTEMIENPDCNYSSQDYPNCDEIIEKDVTHTVPTGKIFLSSNGRDYLLKSTQDISEFLFREIRYEVLGLSISSSNNRVQFKNLGSTFLSFNMNNLKSEVDESAFEFNGYPVLDSDNKPILIQNFGENNFGTRKAKNGQNIQNDNHIDIYYSEIDNNSEYKFLNGNYTNRPFQLIPVDSTYIGLINGGLPNESYYTSWAIYINDADENGFNGYSEFSINFNEEVLQELSEEEIQEIDDYKNTFVTFYNVATKSELKLRLNKNFVTQKNKLHKVGNRLFVSDNKSSTTQEIILSETNPRIVNTVTPISTLGTWREDNRYSQLNYIEGENGVFKVFNKQTGESVVDAYFNSNGSYFIATQDNYYVVNKEIFEYIWFKKDSNIYRPEQFDLQYNRPDKVLEKIGSSSSKIINSYHKLYKRRLRKMGLEERAFSETLNIPMLEIEDRNQIPSSTKSDQIKFTVVSQDSLHNIHQLRIWNNNVPILVEDYKAYKLNYKKSKIIIDLAVGINKIQMASFDENGIASNKETIYIQKIAASKKPNLYVLSIGVSQFENDTYNLTYAAKDAVDVATTLKKSDAFEKIYTKTLTNEKVTEENMAKSKDFFEKASIDDVVVLFIASHGVLDDDFNYFLGATKMNFDQPEQGGISYERLEKLLATAKSLKKIILIDACHSGELEDGIENGDTSVDVSDAAMDSDNRAIKTRGSGSSRIRKKIDDIAGISKQIFTDLRTGNGINIISSAGGEELAYEGEEWNNGLFTYNLLHGLISGKADLDRNGIIMLSELQEFTFNEVSRLSNGLQSPTFRRQNRAIDYRVW